MKKIKNNKLKLFRYKVTINKEVRIVTVGILPDISSNYREVNKSDWKSSSWNLESFPNVSSITITTYYPDIVDYSFAHVILSPEDYKDNLYKKEIELGKIKKRIEDTDYCKYDFEIPLTFHSYGVMKAFAFSYCKQVMHHWCDIRDIKDKIIIEDYEN